MIKPFYESDLVAAVSEAKLRVDNLRRVYGDNVEPMDLLHQAAEDLGIVFTSSSPANSTFIDTIPISIFKNKDGEVTIGVAECEYDSDLLFCMAFGFGFYYYLLRTDTLEQTFAMVTVNPKMTADDVNMSNIDGIATALFLLVPSSDVDEVRKRIPGDEIAQALALCKKHRHNGVNYHKALLRLVFEETAFVDKPTE